MARTRPEDRAEWRQEKARRRRIKAERLQWRAQRRRAWYIDRVEAATQPEHRVQAAFDYLRTQLTYANASAEERDRVARTVADHLVRTADTITVGGGADEHRA